MPRDSGQKAIKSNELFHWQARFPRITLFWSACYMGLPLSLSRCKSAAYCLGTCVSVQRWLCFSSQLATSLIILIHRWQQAIFSHLVDDHVIWNTVGSLPEVKIYYVCPFLPICKACWSVRGGKWIGPNDLLVAKSSCLLPIILSSPCGCKLIRHLDLVANSLFVIV